MFEHFRFDVDKGQSALRIDKYLMGRLENATRNKIQQAAQAGNILVNNVAVKSNYKVKPKDIITIVLSEPPRDTSIYAEEIPLHILYEDDDLIVVDKQAGLVVHPGHGNYSGTLLHGLKYHFQQHGNDSIEPLLAHRIDKDTSGVLVIAKDENILAKLAKQFFDHSIERKYQALVWGNFEEDNGTIDGNLARNPKNRLQMTVFPEGEIGKHAVTHYRLLERFGYVSLIECQLETGRTHQIRAHMKYIGHPIFNDARYGGDQILKGTTFTKYKQYVQNCFTIIPRQALHAKSLKFIHPRTGKSLFFETSLPDDFSAVIEKWRNYSQHVLQDEN
ncbi:MAG: RluA family pseudouridine synthase [Bacteroidales bacterium]|nr:RluA family pseudouridine synthase [Bacteroidales bacterium]